MARAHKVEHARKDYPEQGIKKGDTYWWWKFRFGGKHFSKTPPKQSALTQSEFWSQMYEIQEEIEGLSADAVEDLQSQVQDIAQRIRDLGEECDSKRSNMPDSLQESDSGTLLQERYDECNSMADELESVDMEVDESEVEEEAQQEWDELPEEERKSEDEEKWITAAIEDKMRERIENIISDIQAVQYSGS